MPPPQLTREFPLRHPFVWIGCPVIVVASLVVAGWFALIIGIALCAFLVAVAWPAPARRRLTWEDWMDYPEPAERTIRIPQVDLVSGEVMDEVVSGDGPEKMYGITPPKQIGSGR